MNGLRARVSPIVTILVTLAFLGVYLGLSLGGCGSEQDTAGPEEDAANSEIAAEEIKAHPNVIEGELGQPVEAQLQGEVMATAASLDKEESWMLLRVDTFRLMGVPEEARDSTINIPAGTEVSVRYRETAETEPFSPGDILSIHIRITKSKDGPVLIAMDWHVI